jgi:hypothetical protein
MEFPEGVSDSECAAEGENFSVQCVSQFDQIYVSGHGDYNPKCSAATETVTPRPTVVQPEASGENVSDSEWATLISADGFDHMLVLDAPCECGSDCSCGGASNTVLLWNAAAGGPFQVRMIHRGYVGYMSFGLAHPGGRHYGMNGAQVVQGNNWDDGSLTVEEYRIHEQSSSFRTWYTPLSESEPENVSLTSSSFTLQNGVTTLDFTVQGAIYKKELNLTSSNMRNAFIWAITQRDQCHHSVEYGYYCGHHSTADGARSRRPEMRGVFWLDLASGEREHYKIPVEEEADAGEDTSSSRKLQGSALVWAAAVLVLSLIAS